MTDRFSSDLLVPFESNALRGDYRSYFKTKRENFRASINNLPLLWECFQLFDEIWIRELSDTQQIKDPNLALPAALFRDAHARWRGDTRAHLRQRATLRALDSFQGAAPSVIPPKALSPRANPSRSGMDSRVPMNFGCSRRPRRSASGPAAAPTRDSVTTPRSRCCSDRDFAFPNS